MKNPKPAPVVVQTLCSLCDEDWAAHGADPTTADCIRLLKARLAVRPSPYIVHRDWWWNQPYWGTSSGTITVSNTAATGSSATVTYLTPRDDDGPAAIGAVA